MNIELESMAIEMPRVAGHPNREPFRGVLTLVDVVSDRAPAGARGHRVVLRERSRGGTGIAAGMGLDYAPSLDRHDARRKIGVITRAEIVGKQLELGGYLFAKDFPEIVREIGLGSRTKRGRPYGEAMESSALTASRQGNQAHRSWACPMKSPTLGWPICAATCGHSLM